MKNFWRKYFRRVNKEETFKQIEEHRKIVEENIKTVSKAIAALDGETGWFECGCRPVKHKNKNGNLNNGTCTMVTPG